ncbi:MAG TPA: hypothetical protein VE934_11925 [Polaromonas sp.]|uniref:hypothetical protein n=1 Tax=Polaromonas sp. TaxID=1869339 RepID=UPI002D6BDFB5|nr:hypothetical protein [Polaromonas sp.]HYW57663.1 hypothetical protein [Polaromonas sp.]
MKHDRLAMVLFVVWLVVYHHVVRAATLSEFMGGYDWQSLRWAAAIALLGGALRTIFSLQSDVRVVREIAKEAVWDALKALAAGLLTFVVLEAIRSTGWLLSSEVRFTAVLVAGIFRMDTIYWLRDAGRDWLAARRAQFVAQPLDQPAPKDPL